MSHRNPPPSDLEARKAALRRRNAGIRASIAEANPESPRHLARHASALAGFLVGERIGEGTDIEAGEGTGKAMIIAGYWPIRSEIDPIPLLAELTGQGFTTALPSTPRPGTPLIFHRWRPGDPLTGGLYGTSEPRPDAPVCAPDCVLVPMLAFDGGFFRLGYGGGFYDRTLAVLRRTNPACRAVGIAYDALRVDSVPTAPHDARLDAILTPEALLTQPQEASCV